MYIIGAYRLRVTFYLCIMGYSRENKMAAAQQMVSMLHALMWLVILVISQLDQTELSLIPDNTLRNVI